MVLVNSNISITTIHDFTYNIQLKPSEEKIERGMVCWRALEQKTYANQAYEWKHPNY